MRATIHDLKRIFNANWLVIDGLIKILTKAGLATKVDYSRSDSGKGRPHVIYEIPDIVTINLTTGQAWGADGTQKLPTSSGE